jgi:hypothetical protein
MAERRTFRERAKSVVNKSVQLLKKLGPERPTSKIKLNRELVGVLNLLFEFNPKPEECWERVKELVAAGADANFRMIKSSKTAPSITALMIAAWYARTDICALLLANGANLDAKDSDGKTALAYTESELESKYSKDRPKTAKFLRSVKPLLQLLDRETLKAFLPSFSECVGL